MWEGGIEDGDFLFYNAIDVIVCAYKLCNDVVDREESTNENEPTNERRRTNQRVTQFLFFILLFVCLQVDSIATRWPLSRHRGYCQKNVSFHFLQEVSSPLPLRLLQVLFFIPVLACCITTTRLQATLALFFLFFFSHRLLLVPF